jgi:hypothetical protein
MTPITRTDYPALAEGYPSATRTELSIVGLDLSVWGLNEVKGSKLPIACVVRLFVLLCKEMKTPCSGPVACNIQSILTVLLLT